MAICSYLVIPAEGSADDVYSRLTALPGCAPVRATNREVLLLVTETPDAAAEKALQAALAAVDGIRALVLTFGEVEAGAVEEL